MPGVDINFGILAPLLTLAVAGLVVLVLDLVLPGRAARPAGYAAAVAGIAVAALYAGRLWEATAAGPVTGFNGAFVADRWGVLLGGLFLLAALAAVALVALERPEEPAGVLAILLWAAAGMMALVGAGDLMILFLGLELLSLALYVLVCHRPDAPQGREAALKYLILGSVASGLLLLGIAFLFGATGAVDLENLAAYRRSGGTDLLFALGLVLVVVGLAFKLGLVPFHSWVPDVYQGAPTAVTGFMSVATKAAAFGALVRFLVLVVPGGGDRLLAALWIAAALSMLLGNLAAIPQQDLKRLLGYSSIAHAGYLLVALPGLTGEGVQSAAFYLIAYALMNLGAFAVIAWLEGEGEEGAALDAYRGLFYRRPWLAAAMALFLLALAGLPPTAGFPGKLLLLSAGLAGGGAVLAGLLIATTVASLYAYLKVVVAMFAGEPAEAAAGRTGAGAAWAEAAVAAEAPERPAWQAAGPAAAGEVERPEQVAPSALARAAVAALVAVCGAGTVLLGLWPQPALEVVRQISLAGGF